ncbi:MFS transporter [Spongiactinospora gelatinilytica]|uniref:MFS transporter n=1 Tax=Spongiactinospora gelatinilytica TaxID=2666298 RepID=A0A2W2FS57_9ACTN|nr:MFS transporter [Spongiactinospora gelatinilytica]PZG28130.1 MFS transporter [Spongiactinospora gelatinilytica]
MTEPTVADGGGTARWLRGPFRPFQHGQYRLLTGSLTASLLGEGLWLMAMVWQVIALGGGAVDLSIVSTGTAVGMVATALLGGVVADRVPQRRILLVTETVLATAAVAIAVLALLGVVQIWHLAAVALIRGLGSGFYYPAYSAMLPSIVPASHLLAANGFEGMLRPVVLQAAGPALASLMVAAHSPAAALTVGAVAQVAAMAFLILLRPVALRRDRSAEADGHPVRSMLADMREGFVYMLKTPWLLATLIFSALMVLLVMGPMEVLIPFAVKDGAGGGPKDHAIVMAAFGVSGALASLIMASRKLPRRYLTAMNVMWGLACLPFVLIGVANQIWLIVVAAFVLGALFNAPMVIWGTLLQRRVPPALLGRVSSLDFFVSLVFMPISMALAGPVSEAVGLTPTFVIAGLLPLPIAIVAILLARMPADEIAHPLDHPDEDAVPETAATAR